MAPFSRLLVFMTLVCMNTFTLAMPADTYGARNIVAYDAIEGDFGGGHVGLATYRRQTDTNSQNVTSANFDGDNESVMPSVSSDQPLRSDSVIDIIIHDIEPLLERDVPIIEGEEHTSAPVNELKLSLPKASAPKKVAAPKAPAKAPAKAAPPAPKKTTAKAAAPPKSKAKAVAPPKTTAKATATKAVKTSKTTANATSTSKAAATSAAPGCPLPSKGSSSKAATTKSSSSSSLGSKIKSIFIRDNTEFVGFHGTNSDTATLWKNTGFLVKPTKPTGFFDFLGVATSSSSGSSGADEELGPGVYVTDDLDIAVAFANNNAKVNPGTTAQVCALFARSSSNWRTAIRKAFIPENLVGDSSTASIRAAKETSRILHIKSVIPGVSATSVVKFSLLNRSSRTGQLVIPATITNQFSAQCFDTTGTPPSGTSKFPAFSYNGNTLREEWEIVPENGCST